MLSSSRSGDMRIGFLPTVKPLSRSVQFRDFDPVRKENHVVKFGRNGACWCGSGTKYKRCHYPSGPEQLLPSFCVNGMEAAFDRAEIEEKIRKAQQGEGRPLISADFADHKLIAVGNTLHYSKSWKTFADFLLDYIKKILGPEWGDQEIKKDKKDRHSIILWYQNLCLFQAKQLKGVDGLYEAEMNGAAICYLGLAYNLFLIKHNVKLQEILIARLKDHQQFQGAYYELIVANCLIRAGFDLALEDETDLSTKHCEFSATSSESGEKYWIEAKARSVKGLLGKSAFDSAKGNDPTSQMTKHINEALSKPAPDRRMIFVDINGDPQMDENTPAWISQASRRIEGKEKNLEIGQEAYVFVTNFSFHRALDEVRVRGTAHAYGLGIPDFGKDGPIRLLNWFKSKQKHLDAFKVMDALRKYPQIPETFDGKPSSQVFAKSENGRFLVGETYFFEDVGENGTLGKVESIAVDEFEKAAALIIGTPSGSSMILDARLSDSEVADYKKYGNLLFGDKRQSGKKLDTIFDFYEWLIGCYSGTPKNVLLEMLKERDDFERLQELSHQDLILEFCEGIALSVSNDSAK